MLNINACLNKTAELRLFLIVQFLLSSVYISSTLLSCQNKGSSLLLHRNILPASRPASYLWQSHFSSLFLYQSLFQPLSHHLFFTFFHSLSFSGLSSRSLTHVLISRNGARHYWHFIIQHFCFQCGQSQPVRIHSGHSYTIKIKEQIYLKAFITCHFITLLEIVKSTKVHHTMFLEK